MARVTVEDCLTKVPNRFALVILASKRTKQLMDGAKPLIDPGKNKPAVLALREIAEGHVHFDRDVEDALRGKYDPPKRDMQMRPVNR